MHKLPDLPYAYNALEPYIDSQTMEIHHKKHHQKYVDNLNEALEKASDWQEKTLEEILTSTDQLPEAIRTKVRNNGGGHHNHSLFWQMMAPDAGGEPGGQIGEALNSKFGSFEEFKASFTEAATGVFGSGWAWLVVKNGELEIISTPNQDSPLMQNSQPVLGLDVWEHAYYLKHKNKRPNYIEAFWKVVNWSKVEELYQSAK